MKKHHVFLVLGLALAAPPLHAESAQSICTAEARDAGIDDEEEIAAYVDECLSMMSDTGDVIPSEESAMESNEAFDNLDGETDSMTE